MGQLDWINWQLTQLDWMSDQLLASLGIITLLANIAPRINLLSDIFYDYVAQILSPQQVG